jgi:hypothetical protein
MKNNKSLVLLLKIVVFLVVIASIVITTMLVIKKTRKNINIHDIVKNNVRNNNMKNNVRNNNMKNNSYVINNRVKLEDLCRRYIIFSKNIKGSTLNDNSLSQSQKMSTCRSEIFANYDISPNTKYIDDNVELMFLYDCLSGSNSLEGLVECITLKALQNEFSNENNWN